MKMKVIKRDGKLVDYDQDKIEIAISKCFSANGNDAAYSPGYLADEVSLIIEEEYPENSEIGVEQIQDIVEEVLMEHDLYKYARAYILYREKRASQRVSGEAANKFDEDRQYFPTELQRFQFYDKYSRFNYELGRRETWVETVDRVVDFLKELSENKLTEDDYEEIRYAILNMEAMPSMRLMAMAGPAARRSNITIYNCSYVPVDSFEAFVEALIISMSGCGVGFSVESKYTNQLPVPSSSNNFSEIQHITVEDSSEGWADALRELFAAFMRGQDVEVDYSLVRPAGAPLMTKGGRASGPEPLRKTINFIRGRLKEVARRGHWRPLDAHDIMCSIGDAAVQGGVRRTAMISLFDFDDTEMRHCKDGDFWIDNSQRWNANNSAVFLGNETQAEILDHMHAMVKGQRGEPGIFSRHAAKETMFFGRDVNHEFGTNPCGEIVLRPMQFCNLTSAVLRPGDSVAQMKRKVRTATIIGTIQSMATHFPGLREEWVSNCKEERLLGVDLNGIADTGVYGKPDVLNSLKVVAVDTNYKYAKKLGINESAAITCVKPSGNSSTLLNTSPGIHPRWSQYYIRNVRVSASSPVYKVLLDAGVPMSPENGQTVNDATTWVVHFPVAAPEGATVRTDLTALDQLENWLNVKEFYTEHNPSVTITYEEDEVIDVISWVSDNINKIGGMSFLPSFDALYENMPYVEVDEEEYNRLSAQFPSVDWSRITVHEHNDMTRAAQELACSAGLCDII